MTSRRDTTNNPSSMPRISRKKRPAWQGNTPRFVLLCLEAILFLAPIYWMLITSFKTESDTTTFPPQIWPLAPTLENYAQVLNTPEANLLRWLLNSIFVGLVTSFLHVSLCVLTAYPLARMKFKGRDVWFWFLLSSLMVPGIVTLIPSYIQHLQLGWIDSYHALIWRGLPAVFGVFLMRQFFLSIPRELEEAAVLDGANHLQILRHVIVPLSIPALVTLSVFAFLGSWNDYVWPLFVVHGDLQTLPVGLASFSSRFGIEYGKLMASASLSAIPSLIAYLLAQRYIVQGLTLTGLKD